MELVPENKSENASEMDKQAYGEIVSYKDVENTPFTIVKIENEYFGAIGNKRITEKTENEEELEKDLKEITWNRLMQVIWIVSEKFNKAKIKENE